MRDDAECEPITAQVQERYRNADVAFRKVGMKVKGKQKAVHEAMRDRQSHHGCCTYYAGRPSHITVPPAEPARLA